MKARNFLLPTICFVLFFTATCSAQYNYPPTKQIPVTDVYFGKSVTDNYRWLENMNDPLVQQWFKAQHDFTDSLLNLIPGRDSLFNEFKRLFALVPAQISGITRKANRYFYKKTLPGDRVGKLYYRNGKYGEEILLYDPANNNSGKPYSINYFVPSEDGKKVAFGISEGGAEIATIHIINVDTKTMYPETIFPSGFGVSGWSPDNKGFIYTLQTNGDNKSMKMLTNSRSMYHVLGTDVKNDKEIFSLRKYPNLGIVPEDLCMVAYSEDFKYIFGELAGVNNDLNYFYAPASSLLQPTIQWKRLLKKEDHVTSYLMNGDDIYMLTYTGASKYKIIKSNLKNISVSTATVVVPEEKNTITDISRTKDYMLISYSDGINSTAKQYNLHNGKLTSIHLPFSGTVVLKPYDIKTDDALVSITSWKQPITLFDYNAGNQKMNESAFSIKTNFPGIEDMVVEEVEAPSYDGTMVPLSIIYNKNLKKDGNANCILDGYGAYGNSLKPSFSPLFLAILNKNIVIAVSHVRGGGEKGEAWYKAGYKTTKPNTWKDFIACGEYLVKNNYTSKSKLIGWGGSAGGILIGRAITERPDLFGAAISQVSVSNALRSENSPNGINNTREFGTVKDSIESLALYEMDAFQHVKDGTKYPAVICVGGMNDPRVPIWQPGKFAAALQNASTSGKPVLMKVDYDNGHFTEDKDVAFKGIAGMFAFALWQTGNPYFQMKK